MLGILPSQSLTPHLRFILGTIWYIRCHPCNLDTSPTSMPSKECLFCLKARGVGGSPSHPSVAQGPCLRDLCIL